MQKAPIYIDQGTDWSTPISISDANSLPISIVGANVVGAMKTWYTSNTSYPFVVTVANATQGSVVVSLSANTTKNIPAGRYVYNINLIDAANKVSGIVEGIATVNPEVV